MDRSVDKQDMGPFVAQTVGGFLASVSGTVVHDPKDPTSGLVGLLAQDFADEAIDGFYSVFHFAATEDLGAMDIPSCQIGPGPFAEVLVLDARRAVGCRRRGGLFTAASLPAALFVCRKDVVISAKWSALPNAFVQIEDRAGFVRKVGIARENPASLLPRAKGIAAEPAP